MKIRVRLKSHNGGYALDSWNATYKVASAEWCMAANFLREYEKKLKNRKSNFDLDENILAEQSYIAKCIPIVRQNQESWMDIALRVYYS